MKHTFKMAALISSLAVSAAFGQSATQQVIEGLQAQGFTRVEVENGPTQMKVEAVRGNQKVELVYDVTTGDLLSNESGRVGADDDTSSGVEVSRSRSDFIDDDEGDDDRGRGRGHDDDSDEEDDDSSDDSHDDDGSDDDSSDHDSGDHDSGDHDSDSDSDSGDSDSDSGDSDGGDSDGGDGDD